MKKFLVALCALAALLVAAAAAVAFFLPVEKIEAMAREKVQEATGRAFGFSGARVVFFPNIGLRLQNVTLGNAPWGREKNMISLSEIDLRLALRPLLDKRVEVKRFILKDPVIHLEVAADGRANWEFPSPAAPEGTPAPGGGTAAEALDFRLGTFKISGGVLSYAAPGAAHRADDIDVTVTFPDLDGPLQLDGALDYRGKRVNLALDVEKPVALAGGKPSAGSLDVRTADFSVKIDGAFSKQGTLLDGTAEAQIDSLENLLVWLGTSAQIPFEKVSFRSAAKAGTDSLKLSGATLALDEVEAKGDLSVGFAGKPDITARLSVNKITLDRFMGGAEGGKAGAAAGSGSGSGWDDTPLDLSALNAMNANVALDAQGFSLKGMEVGPSRLTAVLKEGNLKFMSSDAALFGGTLRAALGAAAGGAFSLDFGMKGVQAKPVLSAFAGFSKLSGAADADVSVTAAGKSQKAIVSSLAGKGSVIFRDGSFEGIDLVNIAKMLQSRLDRMGVGAGKTDFVALGGTFTIDKGMARNNDFSMKGPLVRATGAGSVDLPRRHVDYRLHPLLTASSAAEDASGLGIPVDIRGPFSDIKVSPDYAAALRSVAENPGAIKETGKQLEGTLKTIKQDIKKDPAKALEGLLGGGLPGLLQQPAPAP